MFDLAIKGFRGFNQQEFVPIRPITILIGENSTGKTSFLAALHYLFDFASSNAEASFNKDPFHLGTFRQIAHFRGGSAGRVRQFEFRTRQTIGIRDGRSRKGRTSYNTELALQFAEVDSDPAIIQFEVSHKENCLQVHLTSEGMSIFYSHEGSKFIQVGDPEDFPMIIHSEFTRYWPILLRELIFHTSHEEKNGADKELDEEGRTSLRFMTTLARESTRHLSERVLATSAIRTKPQRTYTPTGAKIDGEGSHVPFEIAKLYRSKSKSSWRELKSKMEHFGKQSQMFRQIDVKSFGNTTDDPFQIQFSFDGPKMNLVDLGYGTSQVLPILFSVAQSKRGSRFLIQQPEVHLHAKAQASLGQFFLDSFVENRSRFVIETHSDFIIDRFRLGVKQGKISKDDISILFFRRSRLEDEIFHIQLSEQGQPIDAPEEYRQFFIDEQMKLLGME